MRCYCHPATSSTTNTCKGTLISTFDSASTLSRSTGMLAASIIKTVGHHTGLNDLWFQATDDLRKEFETKIVEEMVKIRDDTLRTLEKRPSDSETHTKLDTLIEKLALVSEKLDATNARLDALEMQMAKQTAPEDPVPKLERRNTFQERDSKVFRFLRSRSMTRLVPKAQLQPLSSADDGSAPEPASVSRSSLSTEPEPISSSGRSECRPQT